MGLRSTLADSTRPVRLKTLRCTILHTLTKRFTPFGTSTAQENLLKTMSMTNNKKLELLAQEIYAKGVNKQTHYDTPQGKVAYPKVDYDKLWNVQGYYNDDEGNDIRCRD
jgi:hypothetical protein